MKKFISIFLTMVMVFFSFPAVFAADTAETQVKFNLTCDGKDTVSKNTGDIITVTYTLENVSDENAKFLMTNISNEIYYDRTFFEYVSVKENPLDMNTSHQISFDNDHYVFFNKSIHPAVEFEPKQLVGTFELKIIAENGSSTVKSVARSAVNQGQSYDISVSDLTVNIGGAAAPTLYRLVFDAKGGSTINDIAEEEGTSIDLTAFVPIKNGYTFKGWYKDEAYTTSAGDSIILNADITLYAKWSRNGTGSTGSTGSTGGTGGDAGNGQPIIWKNPFRDVSANDWHYESIKYINSNGFMKGTSEATFEPDTHITRGMFVTILYRIENEPDAPKFSFNDVVTSEYYSDAVAWASEKGIVLGFSETEFGPDRNITREQMTAIIHRYAKFKGFDISISSTAKLSFADADIISDYAKNSVLYCSDKKIINGKDNNMLDPQGFATRAETAAMLMRFIERNR